MSHICDWQASRESPRPGGTVWFQEARDVGQDSGKLSQGGTGNTSLERTLGVIYRCSLPGIDSAVIFLLVPSVATCRVPETPRVCVSLPCTL